MSEMFYIRDVLKQLGLVQFAEFNDHISPYTTSTHFVSHTVKNNGSDLHRNKNQVRGLCVGKVVRYGHFVFNKVYEGYSYPIYTKNFDFFKFPGFYEVDQNLYAFSFVL